MPFGFLIFFFFHRHWIWLAKGCIVVDSFRTFLGAPFKHFLYTASTVIGCSATDLRTIKKFRVESKGFDAPSVLPLDRPKDRNNHRVG